MTNFMTHSKSRVWHPVSKLIIAVIFAVVGGVSCTFDESFGLEYVPSSQDFALFSLETNTSFETSFRMSDSIRSSNIGLVTMGVERAQYFGERRAGFFSQFVPVAEIDDSDDDWDEDYPLGYMPILDSMTMYFSMLDISGDTTQIQTYAVYEVQNTDFLKESVDSVYFGDFDTSLLDLSAEPIFTFTFPDQPNGVYTNTTVIRLYPPDPMTYETQSFLDKLLLQDYDWDMDIYDEDNFDQFVEKIKGIYIVPTTELTEEPTGPLDNKGGTYSMYVDASGIKIYARSVYPEDPSIVKDTLYLDYGFRHLTKDYYGMSINTVERTTDLTSEFNMPSSLLLVEGMGGIVSTITITQEIFESLDKVLTETLDSNGNNYNTIFMNQARLDIFLPGESTASYDASTVQPLVITPWFDDILGRLGMYTDFTDYYLDEDDYDDDITTLTGIEDYYYDYELDYGITLPYNGYINRTYGCYEMIISAQLQEAWNNYLDAKEEAGGDASAINWDDVDGRVITLGPVADELFTVRYSMMQGMNDGTNESPIRLRLTYTLVK